MKKKTVGEMLKWERVFAEETAVQAFFNLFSFVLIGCHMYEIWFYPSFQFSRRVHSVRASSPVQ
jgi:hypothetical protein